MEHPKLFLASSNIFSHQFTFILLRFLFYFYSALVDLLIPSIFIFFPFSRKIYSIFLNARFATKSIYHRRESGIRFNSHATEFLPTYRDDDNLCGKTYYMRFREHRNKNGSVLFNDQIATENICCFRCRFWFGLKTLQHHSREVSTRFPCFDQTVLQHSMETEPFLAWKHQLLNEILLTKHRNSTGNIESHRFV